MGSGVVCSCPRVDIVDVVSKSFRVTRLDVAIRSYMLPNVGNLLFLRAFETLSHYSFVTIYTKVICQHFQQFLLQLKRFQRSIPSHKFRNVIGACTRRQRRKRQSTSWG